MKKLFYIFVIILLFVSNKLESQIFTVSSGTDLFISSGTTFSADGLTLVPSANLTLTNLSLTKNSTISNAASPTAVSRFYKFSATTNSFSGTLQVNYSDGELAGLTESTLQVNVHNGTIWGNYASTTNDASNNYVLSNSLSSVALNEIALAGSSAPLPVELKSFSAGTINGQVVLNWTTATEISNFGFDIERTSYINHQTLFAKAGGSKSWTKVGFVKGIGTSNNEQNYSFKDPKLNMGKYEYRLKQIDLDGETEYSKSVEVSIGINKDRIVLSGNYPNPFNAETIINYQMPFTGKATLIIYDLIGKEILKLVDEELEAGFYSAKFNASNLPSGIYYYNLRTKEQTEIKKMLLMK